MMRLTFSYKQTVELGNYELDTWLNWAEVLVHSEDLASAIEILIQGQEFYPEEAQIDYKMAGLYLLANDHENAEQRLIKALKGNIKKLSCFESEFPKEFNSNWAQNIISDIKRASE